MRIATITKDKPERVFVQVHNAEATLAIAQGSPACFVLNGTNDGVDVVNSVTATATIAHTGFAGVITQIGGLLAGQYGMAQAYGICQGIKYLQRTRAASTDSWSTIITAGTGCALTIDTVNNAFAGTVAGVVSAYLAAFILAQAQTLSAGSATSTSNSSTAQTVLLKGFLRAM